MNVEEEMRSALETLVTESAELLAEMEAGLLQLENGDEDGEAVAAVFRAAHTIKGSAGLFGLAHVVAFTHVVESVLDRVRAGEVAVTPELVGALLPCKDHMARLMESIGEHGPDEPPGCGASGETLLARLRPYLDGAAVAGEPATGGPAAAGPAGPRPLHLSLRFAADSLRNGMDPLSFIRYLSTLGEVRAVVPVVDLLPESAAMDAETCYLAFEVTLVTDAEVDAVEGVFEFVREDGDIRVLEHGGPGFDELVDSYGAHGPLVRGVLAGSGALDVAAVSAVSALPAQRLPERDGARPPIRAVEKEIIAVGKVPGAPGGVERRAPDPTTIRIDADRLDRLIDAVGELVIAGAGAGLRASMAADEGLEAALGEVMRLVEEVRDGALQLRMVPIGTTFSRFQRVVRDVSAALAKDVQLVITGGDTEVDKALVEQIADPLTHLVRNSLDHGIESAEVRAQRGKPARGTLRLNAFHHSGSIVIEVADDGGGIDPEQILAKAVERGMVEPGTVLPDKDVLNLIFEPGLSTADQVSDLSGRGVGMDVVKRNVTALRGTLEVESTLGEGTTIRIRLPLTLAIIDGFSVGVGGSTFIIPLDRVVECVVLPDGTDRRDCMDLRGEVLPFIRLRRLFDVMGEPQRRENVVVVEYAGTKTGLVVDTLKGEFQTVIKPLGEMFGHVRGVGGATILGNGDVALIIDVPMLVRLAGDLSRI